MAGPMKLTPKQARFVQEYLIDPNAAQAADRVFMRKQLIGRIGALTTVYAEPYKT
jgi:hypothetical protein